MGKTLRNVLLIVATSLAACTGQDSIVGTWVGYVEQAPFGASSDRIEVVITEVSENGSITGTIAFGEPGTLPPPTDPDVGYPEGLLDGMFTPIDIPPFVEKFTYSLSGSFDAVNRRLQGDRNKFEVWSDWCELQTEVYPFLEQYQCLPNCGFLQMDNYCELPESCELPGEVDCAKLELCGGGGETVCECGPGGCSSTGGPTPVVDFRLDGDDLQGMMAGFPAYLVRQ